MNPAMKIKFDKKFEQLLKKNAKNQKPMVSRIKPANIKRRVNKYWYCEKCAKKLGWLTPYYPITTIQGLCGHCKRKDITFLIPEVDFIKPREKTKAWD